MKRREFKRQLFHATAGIIIVIAIYFNFIGADEMMAFTFLSLIISLVSIKVKIPFISNLLHHMEREHNLKTLPGKGVFFYLLGSTTVLLFFNKQIALASISILALGDSVSHYIGRFHGKIKHPFSNKREVEGWSAGIIFATFGALFFVPWYAALTASIISMTVEMANIKINNWKVDDNFTIPISAAIILMVILS